MSCIILHLTGKIAWNETTYETTYSKKQLMIFRLSGIWTDLTKSTILSDDILQELNFFSGTANS